LVEGDLGLGLLNLWEERHERLDQVEKSYCRAIAQRLAACPDAIGHKAPSLRHASSADLNAKLEGSAHEGTRATDDQLTATHDGRFLAGVNSIRDSSKKGRRKRR
jgi:hypothetical protein